MTFNSNVTQRSSFLETEAYAGDESLPLAQRLRRGETRTAKRRKRQLSEDEEDIVLVKEARIMLEMANKNVTSVSKESEGTSTATASTSDKMMPNAVTFPHSADCGCNAYRGSSTFIGEGASSVETSIESERNFPSNLHAILSDEHYSHIISWMPHGRAWKVHDKALLVSDVGEVLGISDCSSFKKQLSEWGFRRLYQKGPDYGCYYHESFLRGYPQLVTQMKETMEPDFYAIAKQYPLDKAADMDTERVLFLANVALQFESTAGGYAAQTDSYGQSYSNDPLRLPRKKSTRKKSVKTSEEEHESKFAEDLPTQSKDDKLVITILARLKNLMERTHVSQKQLETYDRQNGLPRSQSQTMMRSSRSRLEFQNLLKKWELRKTNSHVIRE